MSPDVQHGRRQAVFVATDDAGLRQALSFLLRVEGYDVRLFGSAQALAAAPLESADCLVVGDRLPDSPGREALKQLRRRGVAAPAILLVQAIDPPLRAEARKGRFALVEEPFTGDQLVTAVQAMTDRGRR